MKKQSFKKEDRDSQNLFWFSFLDFSFLTSQTFIEVQDYRRGNAGD
jgi:hypothetical protein